MSEDWGEGPPAQRSVGRIAFGKRPRPQLRAAAAFEQDAASRGWRLGVPVLSLARALSAASPLREAMAPLIERLARETHTIIGFGSLHGSAVGITMPVAGAPLHALGIGYAARGQASVQRLPRVIQDAISAVRAEIERLDAQG